MTFKITLAYLLSLVVWLIASSAHAFGYTVRQGDTLAGLAERFYGKVQYENILVTANRLDYQGGTRIVPGMLLEIPAVSYQRVSSTDTWDKLAELLLGAAHRSVVLADVNGSKPWLPPEDGAEVIVPFNLHVHITGRETLVGLAHKYLGERKQAWTISHYNDLKEGKLERGSALLIPLVKLELTEAGKQAAARAAAATRQQSEGAARAAQREAAGEIPNLIKAVRGGRYVDAVTRGTQLLTAEDLTRPQLATVHRELLEAFVALDSHGKALNSCQQWLTLDKTAKLNPVLMSPKLTAVCEEARLQLAKRKRGAPKPAPSAEQP